MSQQFRVGNTSKTPILILATKATKFSSYVVRLRQRQTERDSQQNYLPMSLLMVKGILTLNLNGSNLVYKLPVDLTI